MIEFVESRFETLAQLAQADAGVATLLDAFAELRLRATNADEMRKCRHAAIRIYEYCARLLDGDMCENHGPNHASRIRQ